MLGCTHFTTDKLPRSHRSRCLHSKMHTHACQCTNSTTDKLPHPHNSTCLHPHMLTHAHTCTHSTTDELPHPHGSGDRGVGGGRTLQRQLLSTRSRRLSFDGTDQPTSRGNSVRARAPVMPRCVSVYIFV